MGELDFAALRKAMVVSQLRTSDVNDERIVLAMSRVRREEYVPAERQASAYIDRPVPLGHGRMLNPPLVTGRLLVLADVQPGEKVLLIGAATGYTAAVLAELGAQVVAVEQDDLGGAAAAGVTMVNGPLNAGAPAHAPYDAIIVEGAVEQVPQALTDQLAEGGRIALGFVDRGVCHMALGRKYGGHVGYDSRFDMDMAVLPGFERERGFSF